MARGKLYQRKTNSRKEKPLVLIVPEGAETEKVYFQHFNKPEKPVKIKVVENSSDGAKTDYASLLKKAIGYKNKYSLSKAKGASVWVVADGDIDYKTPGAAEAKEKALLEARTAAEKNGISILISNPCFELWYYLHFDFSTGFIMDYPSMKEKLLPHLSDYEKNKDVFDQLSEKTETAIAHAIRLETFHEENGEEAPFKLSVNPFTEVYRLVETII